MLIRMNGGYISMKIKTSEEKYIWKKTTTMETTLLVSLCFDLWKISK